MLTVACVWVRGEVPYTPEYVWRLRAMVRRWSDRPVRFVCLTDQPELIADVETMPAIPPEGAFAFWTKMQLFNPALGFRGRVLALDLDSLIVGPLAPIVDWPAPFVMATDCLTDVGDGEPQLGNVDRFGRALIQKFQGSVMVWNAGAHADLYTEWTPDVAARLSTDQDWIGERYPNAAVLPLSWTPRISQIQEGPIPREAKIIFCKKPKNHVAAEQMPWVDAIWRAA